MPALSDYHGSQFIKCMLIGNSGTGKTSALLSLVQAGYRVRILDLDSGLDALFQLIRAKAADKMNNVDYETRRDRYKSSASGPVLSGQPKAFTDSLKLLDKWTDETSPATWGTDTILVLDSFTAFGRAAFEWAKGMAPSSKDPRQWYFAAQQALEDVIAMLTGDQFATNVIIISHVNYQEFQDGTTKGTPSAIGSALGPKLAKYLNTLLLAESSGTGTNVKRVIRTVPTALVDLKNPVSFELEATLPLESGLATIFQKLKATNA